MRSALAGIAHSGSPEQRDDPQTILLAGCKHCLVLQFAPPAAEPQLVGAYPLREQRCEIQQMPAF
jgi:hypothetical protein